MSECCPGNACGPTPNGGGLDRREFVKVISIGAIGGLAQVAGPFGPDDVRAEIDHFVPGDKKLDAGWVKALTERGAPTVYRGTTAEGVAMPCGGIGTGEVYVLGDGRLARFDVFNQARDTGYGARNYELLAPEMPVVQGFELEVVQADHSTTTWKLERGGFSSIEFSGQYPVATVRYSDPACPVRATVQIYSPFIPLDAEASGLPVTIFQWKIENISGAPVGVKLRGFLENPVLLHNGGDFELEDRTRSEAILASGNLGRHGAMVVFEKALATPPAGSAPDSRPARVLADFEGEDYGDWKAQGTAFGTKPARGTAAHQQPVTGFAGHGLANSYPGDDDAKGKLTSPAFTVDRKWLNFLIGGGASRQTALRVVVDGKVVHSASGRNTERLSWQRLNLEKWAGKEAHLEIVDEAQGPWGHVNVDQIELSDRPRAGDSDDLATLPDQGTFALAMLEPASGAEFTSTTIDRGRTPVRGAVQALLELAPGQSAEADALLAWHFANHPRGRFYATRFKSAAAVIAHVAANWRSLTGRTMRWRETWYGGTLPHWLLERLHAPVANLATNLVEWRSDGRFWAWEGVGCCAGTCTHVWNYAHAMARLFPELERNVRTRQDLGEAFDEKTGLVGFRGNRAYAADGQCGTVLKAYREHLGSADGGFLKEHWPRIRKALEFSMGHDGNADGLIEDMQHNTFDIEFYGPNPFVGSLYLAALRAGEEMARHAGDDAFAATCRQVFERGAALSMKRLFNGEYFTQEVDLEKHPAWQYPGGCLSDQLFGQGWAAQLGLGYLYPPDAVRSALKAIWKYNWAPDVGPQNARHVPERYFARQGEGGLFICTWPKSKHPGDQGVRYRDEVWTGTEYQVASHLLAENFVTEGLAVVRAIHERYDGAKHNPWNEVECGDHYARSLASFGCFVSLCGFSHDGPAGVIGFDPRVTPERFAAAFTAAEGFGRYAQERGAAGFQASLAVDDGRLRVSTVLLAPGRTAGEARVTLRGATLPAETTFLAGDRPHARVQLAEPAVVGTGEVLEISFG